MRPIAPLWLVLQGCAPSVLPAFEAARDRALADPGPIPEAWEPDAIVTISPVLVDLALDRLLATHGQLEGDLDAGLLRATPRLGVEEVVLAPGRRPRALAVTARLAGSLRVHTPLGDLVAPLRADLDFDAELGVVATNGAWTLTLAAQEVRAVDIHVAGTDLSALTEPVVGWVTDALAGEAVPILDLGSAALPIRAIRARADGDWLRLDLLTDAPSPAQVREPDELPTTGWRLDLATGSLLELAREASLRADPLPRDIVAEPTALVATDDRFVLQLRLWRVAGRGWWRDYAIHGALEVRDGEIALTPESVEDAGHSPGAAWADPLAALGQGVILKTLERALQTSVPAVHGTSGDRLPVEVSIESVTGLGPVIVGHGTLTVGD